MDTNLIALAIPVFFAMIGVEILVARLQGLRVYRLNDAITDLSCGIGSQVTAVFMKAGLLAAYVALYQTVHLLELPETSWATWLVAMLTVDFAYYAWHRTSHRVNFVWATHVPHHQSQDYNFAVALRQAWFSPLTSLPFYLPLAVLGVPPVVFLASNALNTLYQFWIHTETVQRLGPVEWVLNTPTHHRVHHGVNPKYIDRNYGGILIVWDRLLGTFREEEEPVCYGTVKPYTSWNPVWANFEHWFYLFREAWQIYRWRDRIALFFLPPEWHSPERPPPALPRPVQRSQFQKFDTPVARGLPGYVLVHFAITAGATTWMLFVEQTAPMVVLAALGLLILWTTVNWGAMFEGRVWGVASEGVRLGMLAVVLVAFGLKVPGSVPMVTGLGAITVMSVLWLMRHSEDWSWRPRRTSEDAIVRVSG
jgi:sterol desaturase/sphingolipid hydroxylase (fatty acid hydroxylase superfamily)